MKLSEYKKIIRKPLRPRTLVFLMKDNRVLLGFKKTGFGKGYFLGIGGKVEKGESIEEAAKREVREEITVTLSHIKHVGVLSFYFPHVEDESWNQQVHVFVADEWDGEPTESEEIRPEWFAKDHVPMDKMWDDAQYWLPAVLEGKPVENEYLFNAELKVIEKM